MKKKPFKENKIRVLCLPFLFEMMTKAKKSVIDIAELRNFSKKTCEILNNFFNSKLETEINTNPFVPKVSVQRYES